MDLLIRPYPIKSDKAAGVAPQIMEKIPPASQTVYSFHHALSASSIAQRESRSAMPTVDSFGEPSLSEANRGLRRTL
jgi:hypothetical protein